MPVTEKQVVTVLMDQRQPLSAAVWSIVRDSHWTEDVIQEVMVRALANREKITDAEHLIAWSRRTARNLAVDFLRRSGKRYVMLDGDALDALIETAEKQSPRDLQDRTDALKICLGQLPENSQVLIKLRYRDNLNCNEIAERISAKLDAVYQRLSRLHRNLKRCIQSRELDAGLTQEVSL